MIRRLFNITLVSLILLALESQGQTVKLDSLDAYGGTTELSFSERNNDYFATIKHEGKWWLVTPEGNAFYSLGLNHFHANLWRRDSYNTAHWETVFGGTKYSTNWRQSFYEFAHEVLGDVGANTLAYHNEDRDLNDRPRLVPYIRQYRPIKFSLHERSTSDAYPDIFSPEFAAHCASVANEEVKPYSNDKMIIGFAMADVPVITQDYARRVSQNMGYDAPTWSSVLRNLASSAPGKQKYVETMRDIYRNDISLFNTIYGTNYADWTALSNSQDWRLDTDFSNRKEVSDNVTFDNICVKKYYEVASSAFRAVDQNHLFIGDKLNANQALNELLMIVEAIEHYIDVIMIQNFNRSGAQVEVYDKIAQVVDLPIINGDWGFGAYGDDHMPQPQWPRAETQKQRAEWVAEHINKAILHHNVIGLHLCGVMDSWNTKGTQKPGIMNPFGVYHTDLVDTLLNFSRRMYEWRLHNNTTD